MKKLAIAFVLAGLLLNISACNNSRNDKVTESKQAKNKATYYCPMDTSVSDTPGKCPKCGMKLVAKDSAANK